MARVAAIGLDAAEWWLVEQLMAEGEMPHLAALRSRSVECRLENGMPYRSELPWTQFLTGHTARENDYWSCAIFDPVDYSVSLIGAHPGRPFYARDDTKVIAFDLPHSTIHPDVNGLQITAWGAHSAQYPRAARPLGLLKEIDARFGVHPTLDNDYDGGWHQPRYLDAIGETLQQGASKRVDIAEWLLQREPDWDLFVTVLSESHSAGHHFWHGVDSSHPLHDAVTAGQARDWLVRTYASLDQGVGRLVAAVPADTAVVVFAVHGMRANANDVTSLALLPELAHRLHFGEALLADVGQAAWARRGYPPLRPPERIIWREAVSQRFAATARERRRRRIRLALPDAPIAAARRVQRRLTGRPHVSWELNTSFPAESELSIEEMADVHGSLQWQPPTRYRRWWPRMDWFVLPTFSDAHVRINVAGRERDGRVPIEEFHQACDRFESTVRACFNPRTGRSAVEHVYRMREHPLEPNGPDGDLVVVWSDPADAIVHPDVGMVGPLPFQRTGEHSANGFAFVSGPGVEPADIGSRSAFDVPPTILALLGKPADPAMSGTPITTGVAIA
jgi:predicted AlkP superfamily phosphohydrolase/phosphomutase